MSTISQSPTHEVRKTLQAFQDGYSQRNAQHLDAFMQLFVSDDRLEVIGTSAVSPSNEEWCKGRQPTRALVAGDWDGWGNLKLDIASATIHVQGDVAWLATSGTVSQTLTLEHSYQGMGSFLQGFMERKDAKDTDLEGELLTVILGAASALNDQRQGEDHIWPIRFTATLIRDQGNWRFSQIHFSYPTVHLPQVRLGVP